MDYLEHCADLRGHDSDPELFALALAIRHIRGLIVYCGSNIGRPNDGLALDLNHLEAFLARAVERTWKDKRVVQEWHQLRLFLPRLNEAWERGKPLFQEDLDQAKGKVYKDSFSMIDCAVDGYAYLSASRVYPDNPALRNWAINGYMLMWRWHFLKDQVGEERTEGVYDDILL